jgi:hypothetical protein
MKKKFCKIGCTLFMACFGMALVVASFMAISSLDGEWTPFDYWLLWFSVVSAILGLICLVIGIFATSISVGELCDGR